MDIGSFVKAHDAKMFAIEEFSKQGCKVGTDFWFEDEEIVLNTSKAQLAFRTILAESDMIVDDLIDFASRHQE